MPIVRLRTGMALVAISRAMTGGALLLVGLAVAYSGGIGDFGVLARAIAIAHLAAQFTDGGGLAAFTARSADPMSPELRRACRRWLSRRVALRVVAIAPLVAVAGLIFDVPPAPAIATFGALSLQRLAAELWRSEGRTVEFAATAGLPSALWLVTCLVALVGGVDLTTNLVIVAFSVIVAVIAGVALAVVLSDGAAGRTVEPLPSNPTGPVGPAQVDEALAGRPGLFVEGLLEAAVRNIDVVLVTVVVGRDEAGLYAAASRIVAVAMTPLAAANGALAREYAERWTSGGSVKVSDLARRVARRITGFPAAMTAVSVVLAAWFGDDGGTGTVALVAAVLLVSATVSTGAGSAGLLLGICRREIPSARISAVAIVGSVLLLLGLGSIGGLVASAVGFAIGIAGQNIAQARYLRQHVGVVSHV